MTQPRTYPQAAASNTKAPVETTELSIGGMHCSSCAVRTQRTLGKVPGVVSSSVNLATGSAFVAYRPSSCDAQDLCRAVEKAGYTAEIPDQRGSRLRQASDHWGLRAGLAWPLALIAAAVAVLGPETAVAGWIVLVLAALVVLACGWPFLRNGLQLARHRATSMDTLIALGTAAALAVSAVEVIALGGRHAHLGGGGSTAAALHGVMAPIIVAVLATGRAIEDRARDRATSALRSLLSLRPPTARRVAGLDDEQGELVGPETVPVRALLRVRAAETIPLDGVVVAGTSAVDESMLTGEPLPVDRTVGQAVTGGSRNGNGVLVVEVTAVAAESVLARLQQLVDRAQQDKAPLQRIADRISAVFVPAVLGAAVLTVLGWWWVADDPGTGLLSGIAVVLVACPCAMGLAAPVATMVGLGRVSALGVLVRSTATMERLAAIDMVVFDKTGTLTERSAVVSGVVAAPGLTAQEVLASAAAVEVDSDHPVGRAICAATARHGSATQCRALPGGGVSGTLDGRVVQVRRPDARPLPMSMTADLDRYAARGDTIVWVECGGMVMGAIAVANPIRAEAASATATLRAMGAELAVLSGDHGPAVHAVARAVGIDDARSDLQPADKAEAVRALTRRGRRVLMVGDGVNDAPALATADVGCAIGSGTDVALATSDVALVGSDLRGVPAAVAAARQTVTVIRQNFGWAMGFNVSALPLAAFGFLDPLVAAAAMGLSSVVVVANSLRLLRVGRGGLDAVRPVTATSRLRGMSISVAVPILLFAGATVLGQALSPASGEPLLPALPAIVQTPLAGGEVAEVAIAQQGRVATMHLYFYATPAGPEIAAAAPTITAALGPDVRRLRAIRAGTGHFVVYMILPAGTWTLHVEDVVKGSHAAFDVRHRTS